MSAEMRQAIIEHLEQSDSAENVAQMRLDLMNELERLNGDSLEDFLDAL